MGSPGGSKGSKGGSSSSAPSVSTPNLDQTVLGSNAAQIIGGTGGGGNSRWPQIQSNLEQAFMNQPQPSSSSGTVPVPNQPFQLQQQIGQTQQPSPAEQAGVDWLEPSTSTKETNQKPTNPELNDILNSTLGYWLQQ